MAISRNKLYTTYDTCYDYGFQYKLGLGLKARRITVLYYTIIPSPSPRSNIGLRISKLTSG